jgi:DedD protein
MSYVQLATESKAGIVNMGLEERLKQRLLGGAVLVALIVIFVPMLIEEPVETYTISDHSVPTMPAVKKTMPEKRVQQSKVTESRPAMTLEEAPQPQEITKPEPIVTPPEAKPVTEPIKAENRRDKPSPTAWIIQVASLTNEKNAEKLVKDLRKAEMPAQMEKVRLNGKPHYRVRVGPEVDHRLAEKMVTKIKQTFKLNRKLMRYPEQ